MTPPPPHASATRAWVWAQLVVGWLPVFALMTVMIVGAHGGPVHGAAWIALRMVASAALLGLGVRRFAARHPWPRPFRFGFVLLHLGAAALFSASWFALNSAIESVLIGAIAIVMGPG